VLVSNFLIGETMKIGDLHLALSRKLNDPVSTPSANGINFSTIMRQDYIDRAIQKYQRLLKLNKTDIQNIVFENLRIRKSISVQSIDSLGALISIHRPNCIIKAVINLTTKMNYNLISNEQMILFNIGQGGFYSSDSNVYTLSTYYNESTEQELQNNIQTTVNKNTENIELEYKKVNTNNGDNLLYIPIESFKQNDRINFLIVYKDNYMKNFEVLDTYVDIVIDLAASEGFLDLGDQLSVQKSQLLQQNVMNSIQTIINATQGLQQRQLQGK
jgi:hypothetical protein